MRIERSIALAVKSMHQGSFHYICSVRQVDMTTGGWIRPPVVISTCLTEQIWWKLPLWIGLRLDWEKSLSSNERSGGWTHTLKNTNEITVTVGNNEHSTVNWSWLNMRQAILRTLASSKINSVFHSKKSQFTERYLSLYLLRKQIDMTTGG